MDNSLDITSTEATGVQERACNYPCWSSISESYTTPIVPIFSYLRIKIRTGVGE